jgi:hypothetical protein
VGDVIGCHILIPFYAACGRFFIVLFYTRFVEPYRRFIEYYGRPVVFYRNAVVLYGSPVERSRIFAVLSGNLGAYYRKPVEFYGRLVEHYGISVTFYRIFRGLYRSAGIGCLQNC